MLSEAEIKRFIEDDINSNKKKQAALGQKYYEGEHDIKNYRLFYVDGNNEIQEDKMRSNIKISHPFFTELVDQEVQYMLSGKESFIRSDIPELQSELDDYFGDDFVSELQEVLTGVISKGFEYMYAYKDKDDRTRFQAADSFGVVEIRAKNTNDNCDYVIYWYVDRIDKDNKKIKKIQVWNDKEVYYYQQVDEGPIEEDRSERINPRPHTIYKHEGKEDTYYESYGFIPFFRIDNCKKQFSALKPVKDLIDDYDLMSCGLSNNLQDIAEGIYVVKGFQGHDLDDMISNIRVKKHIGVSPDGDVDIRTIDIPYEARKVKLELDEKNIYRFGMGFNSAQIGDGNITNIVIKSRYALLDLKCNKLEIRLRQFLKKLIEVILDEVNSREGTDYSIKDVYIDLKREVMTNASDNATIEKTDAETRQIEINTILNIASLIGNEEAVKLICEQLDIDYEDIKDKLPEDAEESLTAAQSALDGVIPVE